MFDARNGHPTPLQGERRRTSTDGSRLPLRFPGRDAGRLAGHWSVFGARSSPVSGARRHAGNPANALLNYVYALLEAETTLALQCLRAPARGLLVGRHTLT